MTDQDLAEIEPPLVVAGLAAVEITACELCRATLAPSGLTQAEVDVALAHLAHGAAALPQAERQFSDILDGARHSLDLATDHLTNAISSSVAVDTAPARLETPGVPASPIDHHPVASHQQIAHVAAVCVPLAAEPNATREALIGRRAEHREPPPIGCAERGWNVSR